MIFFGRRLAILLVLVCSTTWVLGASSEDRKFEAAVKKLQLGGPWEIAARDLAAFVTNYPTSFRVPEAIFYQAESAITNGQYALGIELLQSNRDRALEWEDDYLLWIGIAQLRGSNYSAAAQTFADLSRRFPGSSNRLEACTGEAAAYAKLRDWPRVIDVLEQPGSAFRTVAGTVSNETVVSGFLLLGEARLAEMDFEGTHDALRSLSGIPLQPESAWRQAHLQCRLDIAEGNFEQAMQNSTNLINLAGALKDPGFRAESAMVQAQALERLKLPDDAVLIYRNLATNAPVEQQRIAILKTAEILFTQGRIADAVRTVEGFWSFHSNSPAASMALLALGELRLKQSLLLGATNEAAAVGLREQSASDFDLLVNRFPSSPEVGRALLGKGWCLWESAQYAAAADTFRRAAERLVFPTNQAVARFKLADAQFMTRDFSGAVDNYGLLVTNYAAVPEVKEKLLELALYQMVRAAIASTNMPAAEQALRRLLDWYPNGFAGDHCLLLLGEGYSRQGHAAQARALFAEFEERFPTNGLIPQVRLAIARSYESEGNWGAAATNYAAWANSFPSHQDVPRAQFFRAWDTAKCGPDRQPEALNLFTNFVAQWPTNALTPQARLWIANYYFGKGDFQNAEESYQYVISTNGLGFEAQMMAGRAAVARISHKEAIAYFLKLVNNPSCPTNLKVQAAFAIGDAYMSAGTTNRQEDLKNALEWFRSIPALDPSSAQIPAAFIRTGDCYKELGAFDDQNYAQAIKAYEQAIAQSNATVAVRNQARVGLGIVAATRADHKTGPEQSALRTQALEQFYNVFIYESTLREGEQPDPYWVKEAGLKAARVAEQMHQWDTAERIYRTLQELLPALAPSWDGRIRQAQKQQARSE